MHHHITPHDNAGPNDPGATELAQRAYQQSAKRRNRGGGSSGSGLMTEDEQLALALAMSVEVGGGGVTQHQMHTLHHCVTLSGRGTVGCCRYCCCW